jgi:peptidoglycan/LPS O-acetylase OafA/YrhL
MLVSMTMLLTSPILRCVMIAGGFLDSETAAMITPLRLDGLAIGSLIAAVSRSPVGLLPFRRLAIGLVLAGGFSFVISKGLYGSVESNMWGLSGVGHLTVSIAVAGILILAVTRDGFWNGLLNWNVLRFFGKYSYGLYVFHYLLQPWLDGAFWFVPSLPAVSLVVHMISATAATLVVALLSWHLYEKQFLKLKKHFNFGPVRHIETEETLTVDSLSLPSLLTNRE